MEMFMENFLAYSFVLLVSGAIMFVYIKKGKRQTKKVKQKIDIAKTLGFHEPVSLHPLIDQDICIGCGSCVRACFEQDILGIVDGKSTLVNASRCVGHGACFHTCPMGAITLVIGTKQRGVDLPHVSPTFETNVPGIYIAGELGGMGLIKNAVEQGKQAVENISNNLPLTSDAEYDLVIIGAGPAGIAASLKAKEKNLKFITLEQDNLGGTVYSYPRNKIIMTTPMELPLHGKVKFVETSKSELLTFWKDVLKKNKIKIHENSKVLSIENDENNFILEISSGKTITTKTILLAIGRRGSPRKLGVFGEEKEKVAYSLLEPELVQNQNVLVVGGGDSAIEAALALKLEGRNNTVTLSYRSGEFTRLKPKNFENIKNAIQMKSINVLYKSNVEDILDNWVILKINENNKSLEKKIKNDLVYIFAGGELPYEFISKAGVQITERFGEALLKHQN